MQRAGAIACIAAGVGLLAGLGWALLTLGVLAWATAPRRQAPDVAGEITARLRTAIGWIRRVPRRAAAVTSMTAGVLGVPAGVLLAYGTGAAMITAGAACVGLSLLTGWNA